MAITWSSDSTRRSSTDAEIALADGVISTQSASGTLMVMDTKTGAIRAWAQYPSYNANDYGAVEHLATSATSRCRSPTSRDRP